MEPLRFATLLLALALSACGSFDNAYDPANADLDSDGDGIKNGEDKQPYTPNNPVRTSSGQSSTTNNVESGWTYYDSVATYEVATQQSPTNFTVPSLAEVKEGYAAGMFSTLSQPVWTSTVAEDRNDQVYVFDLKQGTSIKALKTGSYRALYRSK